MRTVMMRLTEVTEISAHLDEVAERLAEVAECLAHFEGDDEIAVGPNEASALSAGLAGCAGRLLRWNQ